MAQPRFWPNTSRWSARGLDADAPSQQTSERASGQQRQDRQARAHRFTEPDCAATKRPPEKPHEHPCFFRTHSVFYTGRRCILLSRQMITRKPEVERGAGHRTHQRCRAAPTARHRNPPEPAGVPPIPVPPDASRTLFYRTSDSAYQPVLGAMPPSESPALLPLLHGYVAKKKRIRSDKV
jgi:hypothetical protein